MKKGTSVESIIEEKERELDKLKDSIQDTKSKIRNGLSLGKV